MTTFAVQTVINGQLPNALGTIFTAVMVSYIKRVDLFNTDSVSDGIQVWVLPAGGTAYQWRGLTLGTKESADLLDEGESLPLAAGDQVQAVADHPALVNFTIAYIGES